MPSRLDFDWQDSVSPNPTSTPATTRNLGCQLEVVGTPKTVVAPKAMHVDKFVEVSRIAKEAVVHAIQQ